MPSGTLPRRSPKVSHKKNPRNRHDLRTDHPVWSKNSCGLALVVFQEPAKSFTALNRTFILACWAGSRKKQDVALALMIALRMIMFYILVEDMTQGVFAKQNDP